MMRMVSVLVALALLLMLNLTALAQEEEKEKDVLEVCGWGGLAIPAGGLGDWHDSLGAKTGWEVGGDIGYFLRDNVVIGFSLGYSQFGVDGPEDVKGTHHRLYSSGLYAKYYFTGESNLEPYVKAHFGLDYAKFTTLRMQPEPTYWATSYSPALTAGLGAGLFYYTSDYSGLYAEVNYHWANTKDVERSYANETLVFGENIATLDLRLGIRILIGSGD